MGMSASATVAFGVDLGGADGEWNLEDEWGQLDPSEDGESLDFERLVAEFAGFDEVELPWDVERGTPEDDAKTAQYLREIALRESTSIEVGSYGYEYGSRYLYITGTQQRESWGCVPLKHLSWPRRSQVLTLNNFIEHLDGSGLKLKDEFREPKWMLMACYG
jgi:hypothetical protein